MSATDFICRECLGRVVVSVFLPLAIMSSSALGDTLSLEDELARQVPRLLERLDVPGAAIGVVRNGEAAFTKGYGLANRQSAQAVRADTVFNVGSVSKTVTAWGVMRLVDTGHLSLDAPISQYLTRWQFPASEYETGGITAKRLMSHTAGLTMHGIPGFEVPKPLPTIEDVLSGNFEECVYSTPGTAVKAIESPGEKWRYSGGGIVVLQLVIEEVTGESFSDYMHQAVLRPLLMNNSRFGWDDRVKKKAATPYDSDGSPLPTYRFTGTSGAGFYSTITDMTRFVAAGLSSRAAPLGMGVLSERTTAQMYVPVKLSNGEESPCGLGYFVIPKSGMTPLIVCHAGVNAGWRAEFAASPESGDAIVILANSDNADSLLEEVVRLWGKSELDQPLPELPF